MIFLVLLGADQLNTALAVSQMPAELASLGQGQRAAAAAGDGGHPAGLHPAGLRDGQPGDDPADHPGVLPGGDGAGLLGLNPTDKSIWFGILALMVVEIGLVHPPVGMNVYVINRIARTCR
jgi:C4-dicarboxylate transporter DctM subunit